MNRRPRRCAAAAFVLLLASGACTTWVRTQVPAPPAPPRTLRGAARITLVDRSTVTLVHVVIATDSLFGVSNDEAAIHHAFPLTGITRIEEQRKAGLLTLLLLGGILTYLIVFTDVLGV
jgi:hypothetical protein